MAPDAATRGRPALGTWLKLDAPETVEVIAAAGLDFVIIDLEHAAIGLPTVSTMLSLARHCGIDGLVRVPDHSGALAAMMLDQGAAGVVVPSVETAAQARAIVNAVRFAPWGRRSLSTSGRAGMWGAVDALDYMSAQNAATSVYLQIESAPAIRAAKDIADVDGVTGLLVGPMDLTASHAAEHRDPDELPVLLHELERTCAQYGIRLGTAAGTDPGRARMLIERGYGLIAMGNDATMLGMAARDLCDAVR